MLRPLMEENYRLNAVSPTLAMCMLGPADGEQSFHIARNFRASSADRPDIAWKTVQVPVRSFNDAIARIRPTFLVVDIEGGEYELFEYANLGGIDKIMVEIHDEIAGAGQTNALRRKFRRMGFAEETNSGKHFLYQRRQR